MGCSRETYFIMNQNQRCYAVSGKGWYDGDNKEYHCYRRTLYGLRKIEEAFSEPFEERK